MAKEIERKYLVTDDSFISMATDSIEIMQGYLSTRKEATVRVRIAGDRGFLTVKGITRGISRSEWEYEIPVDDARRMIDELCGGVYIHKTRYIVEYAGHRWEVDRFHGLLAPLVVAEVELPSADIVPELPPFVGEEVSDDSRYYNSSLMTEIQEKLVPLQ